MINRFQTALTMALTITLSLATVSRAEDLPAQPMVYAGDGLTVVILKMSEDTGEMSGEIRRDKSVYPFSAKMDDNDDEVIRGNFYVDGKPYAFSAREDADSEAMIFVTGAKRYKLLPVVQQQPQPPQPMPQPDNPLDQPVQPPVNPPVQPPAPPVENPLTGLPGMNENPAPPVNPNPPVQPPAPQPPVAPAQPNPPTSPEPENPLTGLPTTPQTPPQPAPGPSAPATNQPSPQNNPLLNLPGNPSQNPAPVNPPAPQQPVQPAAPAQPAAANKASKVKLAKFNDISMDGVLSHTMLIPEGWTSDGFIQWSGEPDYMPEKTITVTGPDHAKLTFIPTMAFMYIVVNPVPGFPVTPPNGTPPPQNLGAWIAKTIAENPNGKLKNVKLVSDVRNQQFEAMMDQLDRESGGNLRDVRRTSHIVTVTYEQKGVKIREEINVNYALFPPSVNENLRSDMWTLQFLAGYSALDDKFDQVKPQLVAIQSTMRPVAKWWVQMFKVRGEIMRVRAEQRMEEIRRRGKMYDQMSDAEYAKYKESMKGSDQAQKDRVDTIYERQEYTDTDGSIVTLPIHYNHIFSDGNGNYVMTNNSLEKPSDLWTEIKPK